ncbi:MAG: hypothetical protein MJ016_03270, partial [Victivallaceae bacterium]|nr:hypothetical protein [Victivallaceae bacterium]
MYGWRTAQVCGAFVFTAPKRENPHNLRGRLLFVTPKKRCAMCGLMLRFAASPARLPARRPLKSYSRIGGDENTATPVIFTLDFYLCLRYIDDKASSAELRAAMLKNRIFLAVEIEKTPNYRIEPTVAANAVCVL